MDNSKEILVIEDLRVSYVQHWEGPGYWVGDIGRHEISCEHMPEELRTAIEEFVREVEVAHDRIREGTSGQRISDPTRQDVQDDTGGKGLQPSAPGQASGCE